MNKTNFQHALIGSMMHLVIGFGTGNWLAGFTASVFFWTAREHAQREYKIYKWGDKSDRRWYRGFLGWSKDNCLDWLTPSIFNCVILYVASVYFANN